MPAAVYEGLGNSFVIAFGAPVDASEAQRVCETERADGVITATRGENGADLVMILRNADGSRAEVSGNGLACLGRAAVAGGHASGPEVVIDTDAGRRRVQVGDVVSGDGALLVDVGNPHLVFPAGDVLALGKAHLDVNVEVVASAGGDVIDMQVHERGVGITDACGTGAYASAAAARQWGWVGDRVTVRQPGGTAHVDLVARTYAVGVTCR